MLKVCGSIVLLMGIGGLVYAACNTGGNTASVSGPSWLYSRY